METFSYTSATQRVIFGAGSVSALREVAHDFGWHRLMLFTTEHLRENGSIDLVARALGTSLVGIYDSVEPHVPDRQLAEAAELARGSEVDAVIGLGGGSPIGMAKAVTFRLEAIRSDREREPVTTLVDRRRIPTVAIPTTYAGSEMTPVYGVTHRDPDGTTRKVTVRDPKVTPKVVIYDPRLTLSLSAELSASTGVNALAHCIEAVYSRTRNPLSTSAALQGIQHISRTLTRVYSVPEDLGARTEMLIGAHLGGAALATVEMGLHHGTGHVLGGTAGVPHGVANCIVLPHAVRFNADAVAPQLALAGEAMGFHRAGMSDAAVAHALADHLHELIRRLNQPQRLRDAGLEPTLLPQLAENLMRSDAVRSNPKRFSGLPEALSFLQSLW